MFSNFSPLARSLFTASITSSPSIQATLRLRPCSSIAFTTTFASFSVSLAPALTASLMPFSCSTGKAGMRLAMKLGSYKPALSSSETPLAAKSAFAAPCQLIVHSLIQSPTITSTSHFARDRIALCRSVKPPELPAMRTGRLVDGILVCWRFWI